ncbi:MAG: hypothetical protein HZA34_01505 [Candidatus Pacebacteria bacterium]|nr:hypothetical protein [Candidatus Paceibacterota bacterium]
MRALWIGTLGIFFLALLVRLPLFGSIPAGLNRDEAALGYNAYSIFKTGKDEYEKAFPLSITSFGDQKLPGYVYTLIPFIALFGLETWVIRIPSFIAGIAIIFLLGMIAKHMSYLFFKQKTHQHIFVWCSMFIVAISPWANHFSRVAYEAHLALAFFLGGLLIYLRARTSRGFKNTVWWTALFWSATLLTYHSYHILIPLMVLGLFVLDTATVFATRKKILLACSLIVSLVLTVMMIGGIWSGNTKKSQGISPFHTDSVWRSVFTYRSATRDLGVLQKVLFNPPAEMATRFLTNYATTLSGGFFFVRGGENPDHNPGGIPNLHLFALPFILIGVASLWEKRTVSEHKILFMWIFGALAIPAFTIHPEHTVRLSPLFPTLDLLTGLGVTLCFTWMRTKFQQYAYGIIFLFIVIWSMGRYMTQYLVLAQTSSVSHEKYHLLAKAIEKYRTSINEVVTQSPSSSPYIWYLVETQYNPRLLWSTIDRYPEDAKYFRHVHKVGNVTFESIQWNSLFDRVKQHPIVLIFEPRETPGEIRESGKLTFLEALRDQFGNTQYEVWRVE